MSLSIDEAVILETLSREGSIAKTAASLGKHSSAIVYALGSIEKKIGKTLFDRSGYRTKLLPAGEPLRVACQKLLEASQELEGLCQNIEMGFEPDLRFVVEGIVPIEDLLTLLAKINSEKAPTRLHLDTCYLTDVEKRFRETRAEFMVSLLEPLDDRGLESVELDELWVYLVAHRDNAFFENHRTLTLKDLRSHSLLTVKGSDPRLRTPTASIEGASTLRFNDFYVKKTAILRGLGFGWLPEYLIRKELNAGTLQIINWKGKSRFAFKPRLYHRGKASLGRSGRAFLELLEEQLGRKK